MYICIGTINVKFKTNALNEADFMLVLRYLEDFAKHTFIVELMNIAEQKLTLKISNVVAKSGFQMMWISG